MLFRVVEHGSADAVFAISAVQHIDIDATLASTPESLVVCKISEGDRVISQLSIHGHYGRSAGERENFGMWPSSSCQSERHVLDFLINAKMTIRKKNPIVYIKEYQLICDTLALVGASKAVLSLQNEAAIRELRNSINRQTNCLNANLSKTVNAAVKQLNAIKIIQDATGLESLPDDLMELALIRLANPDESLETLRKLYGKDISKSGINHRLNKLIEIAEKIQKDKLKMSYF